MVASTLKRVPQRYTRKVSEFLWSLGTSTAGGFDTPKAPSMSLQCEFKIDAAYLSTVVLLVIGVPDMLETVALSLLTIPGPKINCHLPFHAFFLNSMLLLLVGFVLGLLASYLWKRAALPKKAVTEEPSLYDPLDLTEVWLVRHGQTDSNAERV
jgi:hypothetical protein